MTIEANSSVGCQPRAASIISQSCSCRTKSAANFSQLNLISPIELFAANWTEIGARQFSHNELSSSSLFSFELLACNWRLLSEIIARCCWLLSVGEREQLAQFAAVQPVCRIDFPSKSEMIIKTPELATVRSAKGKLTFDLGEKQLVFLVVFDSFHRSPTGANRKRMQNKQRADFAQNSTEN